MNALRNQVLRRVDAVFFDCDGVLLDSVHVKERQFRAMMMERIPHLVEPALDYYWRNGGTSRLAKFRWIWANLVGTPLSDEETAELGREFAERVFRGVVDCPMVPGAKDFLDDFAEALPCFVLSGTPDAELKAVIEARSLTNRFCDVCGSPPDKTNIGRRLMEEHRLDRARVCFVGDALTDLEAARNLGIRFIGVHGPHLTDFVDADVTIIPDLRSLEKTIAEGD
jgi:phosphoglycolate phosphatase-like HAD superfamily hydrolase